jgi:hypothetical protein
MPFLRKLHHQGFINLKSGSNVFYLKKKLHHAIPNHRIPFSSKNQLKHAISNHSNPFEAAKKTATC